MLYTGLGRVMTRLDGTNHFGCYRPLLIIQTRYGNYILFYDFGLIFWFFSPFSIRISFLSLDGHRNYAMLMSSVQSIRVQFFNLPPPHI
jgi:hypothetical protein